MMKGEERLIRKQCISSSSIAVVVFSVLETLIRVFNWPVKFVDCSFEF